MPHYFDGSIDWEDFSIIVSGVLLVGLALIIRSTFQKKQ